jgi:carbamoyl-phosphate synthase large subunit
MITALVSSAGRRVELLGCFRRSMADLGLDGRVLAVDRSWYASAFHAADDAFLVPGCDDAEFVPRLLELCDSHQVDLVIPTIDPELPVYAAARSEFESVGTRVVVSSPETVAIASDKVETHRWLTVSGFPTVDQAALGEHDGWSYPLVVKPRYGSGALGVTVVSRAAELEVATARGEEMVVQTVAPGREYTIDALVDGDGRCVCAVPRRRLEVRAGEVSKAVTVRSARLEAIAVDICEALPGAYGPVAIQVFASDDPDEGDDLQVIELNARFGGGFPLAFEAGAVFPRWLLEERLGIPSTATNEKWRSGVVMLRYDAAVFVEAPDAGEGPR